MIASLVAAAPPDLHAPALIFSPALWGSLGVIIGSWIARVLLKIYCDRTA
jgi:hypothetical protein